MSHIIVMQRIEIPVRELHARTGHYVRKALQQRIVITDRGKRIAELLPYARSVGESCGSAWAQRMEEAVFAELVTQPIGGTDSSQLLADERNR